MHIDNGFERCICRLCRCRRTIHGLRHNSRSACFHLRAATVGGSLFKVPRRIFFSRSVLDLPAGARYPKRERNPSPAQPSITLPRDRCHGRMLPRLLVATESPASALAGAAKFVKGQIRAGRLFSATAISHAVTRSAPPTNHLGNPPAGTDLRRRYADPGRHHVCPQSAATPCGDLFEAQRAHVGPDILGSLGKPL